MGEEILVEALTGYVKEGNRAGGTGAVMGKALEELMKPSGFIEVDDLEKWPPVKVCETCGRVFQRIYTGDGKVQETHVCHLIPGSTLSNPGRIERDMTSEEKAWYGRAVNRDLDGG